MKKRMIPLFIILCTAIVLMVVIYWSIERLENQEKDSKINNDFAIQNNQSIASDDTTQAEENKSEKKEISDETTTENKVETQEDAEGNLIFIYSEDNEAFDDGNIDSPNSSEKKSDNNQLKNEAIKNNSSDIKTDDDTEKKKDNETENDVAELPFVPAD